MGRIHAPVTTEPTPHPGPTSFGGRIPIVVGVTGHRDLVETPTDPDLAAPRTEVERVLRSLLDEFSGTPLLVLTALAEGADTLAAEVALTLASDPLLRLPDGGPQVALAVALPLPLEAAATDFASPAHVDRVRGLLSRAAVVYVLPGVGTDAGDEDLAARRVAYTQLADHLARHSHVLLALWDGRAGEAGGTEDVVRRFRDSLPRASLCEGPAPGPLHAPVGGRLVHVRVERAGGEGPSLETHGGAVPESPRTFAAFEEFNRDVARGGARLRDAVRGAQRGQALGVGGDGAGWRPAVAPLEAYLLTYAAADTLAMESRDRRGRALGLLTASGLTAVACFETYAHVPGTPGFLLGAYLVAFAVAFAILGLARRARIEDKYLVYRSLAEALRVQIVWSAIGSSLSVAEYYEPLQENEIAWVRRAMKGLDILSRGRDGLASPAPHALSLAWARDRWIKDEIAFYEHRIASARASARRCTVGFRVAAWSGFAVAAGLFAFETIVGRHDGSASLSPAVHGLVLTGMVLLLAIAALLQARTREHAYEALRRRYEAALQVFRRAEGAVEAGLRTGGSEGHAHALEALLALGRAALAENVGWLLLFRDHEMHVDP